MSRPNELSGRSLGGRRGGNFVNYQLPYVCYGAQLLSGLGLECKILQGFYFYLLVCLNNKNRNPYKTMNLMFPIHIFDRIMEQNLIQS